MNNLMLTKVLATLGPASDSLETITALIEAGARVFRINFSHGEFDDYSRLLHNVRTAAKQTDISVGVLGDLCGPKIRVGQVIKKGVTLRSGSTVIFQRQPIVAGQQKIDAADTETPDPLLLSCNYPALVDEVLPGEPLMLDDGRIQLICDHVEGEGDNRRLICRVVNGGILTSRKGLNLPKTDLAIPAITKRDLECIKFAVEQEFDYLALSFVRCSEDVQLLKDHLRKLGARPDWVDQSTVSYSDEPGQSFIPVISKIEKPQALADLAAIIAESDGVMVARGDLGVEMNLEEVPIAQKRIIQLCQASGKPVIVATQMLESMIDSPIPTRAEVSDVANAIFDGADAVMLSGETAVGRWPVEAVQMMSRVAHRTNEFFKSLPPSTTKPTHASSLQNQQAAMAMGVGSIADDLDAKMVVTWCLHDGSAAYLARNRMTRPIIALSDNAKTRQRMSLLYGLCPVTMDKPTGTGQFIADAERLLLDRGYVEHGDKVVFVIGEPIETAHTVNNIVIHRIGDVADGYG